MHGKYLSQFYNTHVKYRDEKGKLRFKATSKTAPPRKVNKNLATVNCGCLPWYASAQYRSSFFLMLHDLILKLCMKLTITGRARRGQGFNSQFDDLYPYSTATLH